MFNKYAIYKSTIGYIKIEYNRDILISIEKVVNFSDTGEKSCFSDSVFQNIKEYLEGKRKEFFIKYELEGTPFQLKVWEELEKIPYGTTKSYKDIAFNIGCKNGSRAVGGAINKNPICIVIPCHRVIGSNNKLVGYAGGLDMKKKLLQIENIIVEN